MDKSKLERQNRPLPKSNRIGTTNESYTIHTEDPVQETKTEPPVLEAPVKEEAVKETPAETKELNDISKEDLLKMIAMMMDTQSQKGNSELAKPAKVPKVHFTVYMTEEELEKIDSHIDAKHRSRSEVIRTLLQYL